MFLMLIIIGVLALVILCGDLFLRGALLICERFKISPFILGATVIAFGTSMPDLFIAVTSATRNLYDISVGSIMGSIVVNILFGIGLASIISGIRYEKSDIAIKFGVHFQVFLLLVFLLFLFFLKGRINLLFSLVLIFCVLIFFFINFKLSNEGEEESDKPLYSLKNIWCATAFSLLGLFGLLFFSDLLLKFILKASYEYGFSKKVIASCVVGLGNSIPEITTCVLASIKKRSRIVLGNIVGSNILILGGVLGISSLLSILMTGREVVVNLSILTLDMPFLIFVMTLFFFFYKTKIGFGRITGLIFIFIYLIYSLLQLNII